LFVPTETVGPSSNPLQMVPFNRMRRRFSFPDQVMVIWVMCRVRPPVLWMRTVTVSP
jgi:hypothetical protein